MLSQLEDRWNSLRSKRDKAKEDWIRAIDTRHQHKGASWWGFGQENQYNDANRDYADYKRDYQETNQQLARWRSNLKNKRVQAELARKEKEIGRPLNESEIGFFLDNGAYPASKKANDDARKQREYDYHLKIARQRINSDAEYHWRNGLGVGTPKDDANVDDFVRRVKEEKYRSPMEKWIRKMFNPDKTEIPEYMWKDNPHI